MEATMTRKNPVQIHLLKMFSINQTESSLSKMKKQLFDFYCHEVEQMGAKIAAERGYDDTALEAMTYQNKKVVATEP